MIKNFLKITIRNLIKFKVYSIINIAGIAVGIAVFILIALLVDSDFSYNRFHKNADRIFCLVEVFHSEKHGERNTAIVPATLSPLLKSEFSEIEDSTRWIPAGRLILKYNDKKFYEDNIWYVDANFLTFFSFKLKAGNPNTALKDPNSIVLTESAAFKYFGNENPIGKVLSGGENAKLTVTGVTEDVPQSSGLKYDFLLSMNTLKWRNNWKIKGANFVRLSKKIYQLDLEKKFPSFIRKHMANASISPKRMYLFPLVDLYFKSMHISGLWWKSEPTPVYTLLSLGIVLLLVVCLNYMNLSTARYMTRSKEIGIRKVFGATRKKLIGQFLGESTCLSILSFPLAIIFYEIMRPGFNEIMSNKFVTYDLSVWENPALLIKLIGVTLLVGLFAGSYPALFLSKLKPTQILEGELQTGRKSGRIRKVLVVSQFVFSIFLIVLAMISIKQYDFLSHLNLGYNRDQVMAIPILNDEVRHSLQPLKNELIKHPDILFVSAASHQPTDWSSSKYVVPEGVDNKNAWKMNVYGIDYDFIEALEMKILKGRSFSRVHNDGGNYIINETAVKRLQWKKPIGKIIKIGNKKGTVIGIAKDFHFKNVYFRISPSVLYLEHMDLSFMFIKLSNVPVSKVIGYITEQWNRILPDQPLEYSMLEKYFNDLYFPIKKYGIMGVFLSLIAIIFSCLGIFGLSSFDTYRRAKEIGIRKVLGSTVPGVIRLLLWNFIRLIILANLIAWPITYVCIKNLLRMTSSYRTDINTTFFIITGILTVISAVLAVVFHTYRAATANPVEALSYE